MTTAFGAAVDECEESEREVGAVVGELPEAGAAAVAAAEERAAAEVGLVVAEGVLDEEALPCDSAETAAEA